MGISGLQPDNLEQVNTNIHLVKMTNKKLKMDEPIIEQYEKKLKQLIFSQRNSVANFFYDNDYRNSYKDY